MSRMVIDDVLWSRLEAGLPQPKGRHGNNDRLFIEALSWILRTGAAWRDLPPEYGSWKTVCNRYNNWSKKGHIEAIHNELKKDGDHEWHMLDASVIKVHQDAMRSSYDKTIQAVGRSIAGLSSKLHAEVGPFGQLLKIRLTAGQVHDSQMADELYPDEPCDYFLADKGYDIDAFRTSLPDAQIQPVIPSKSNRIHPTEYDKHIYKERNIVERFFQKIKRYRRIATRYDKTARMYITNVLLASILLKIKLWGRYLILSQIFT